MIELPPRSKVRFRRDDNKGWTKAITTAIRSKDGSMVLCDDKGHMRSVEDEYVEYEVRGPRGGRTWKPVSDYSESD